MPKPSPAQNDTETTRPDGPTAGNALASTTPPPDQVAQAIAAGMALREGGATKAECARAMYEALANLPRDVVTKAFVEGAGLTEKGSLTYWYNCRRKAERIRRDGERKLLDRKQTAPSN